MMVRRILQDFHIRAPLTTPAGGYDAAGAVGMALFSPPIMGEAALADVFGADEEERGEEVDGGSGGY